MTKLRTRNLGLPVDSLADAAIAAFSGRDRTIDVGWLVVDPDESQRAGDLRTGADNVHCFTVMAGVGFDAHIMNDAPEGVKDKAGWAAYVASGGKHLTDDPFALDLVVDGRTAAAGQVRTVVVGNCGELTAGMVLLPDAEVDDALLDVATVSPESLTAWVGVASRVLANRGDGPSLQRDRGRDLTVRVDPLQLCEVDGDVLYESDETAPDGTTSPRTTDPGRGSRRPLGRRDRSRRHLDHAAAGGARLISLDATVGQLWNALTRTAPSLAADPDEPLLTDPNDADVDNPDPDVTDDPDQDTGVDPSGQMDRTTAEGDE